MAEQEKTFQNKTQVADTENRRKVQRTHTQNYFEYGKIPPQALDLEEAVLGALLIDQKAL